MTIKTNAFRQAEASALFTRLTASCQVAYGDGGHNPDNSPKVPDPAQTALGNELLRKAPLSVSQPDSYSVQVVGQLAATDLVGEVISEAGIIDNTTTLIAVNCFAPKSKGADETMDFTITFRL